MARLGSFDAELYAPAALDDTVVLEGWWDEELIPKPAAAATFQAAWARGSNSVLGAGAPLT